MTTTDITVAAIVQRDNRYLIVEESAGGRIVLGQPGGHIEAGESPEQATVREVLEETGCDTSCGSLCGVYRWSEPGSDLQRLRLIFVATLLNENRNAMLDPAIIARHWISRPELELREAELRSPSVLRCIQDYESGNRMEGNLLTDLYPLDQQRLLESAIRV